MKSHEEYWVEQGLTYKDTFERFSEEELAYYKQQERVVLGTLDQHALPAKYILEVGCGFGRYTRLLYDRYKPVVYDAIDVSPQQIAHTKALCPEVKAWVSSIQELDWRDIRRYDLVFAGEVFLHIPPEEIEESIDILLGLIKGQLIHVDAYPPMMGQLHYPYETRRGLISVSRSRWTYVHPYPGIYSLMGKDYIREIIPPLNRQAVFVVQV